MPQKAVPRLRGAKSSQRIRTLLKSGYDVLIVDLDDGEQAVFKKKTKGVNSNSTTLTFKGNMIALGQEISQTASDDNNMFRQNMHDGLRPAVDVSDYSHPRQLSEIERMNKELDEMKESLIKTSVRCHMLEVDLATQFSPHMVEVLQNAKEECQRCTTKINLHTAPENEG